MTAVTRRPSSLGSSLALFAGFAAVLGLAFGSIEALAAGALGVVVLAGGLILASRRLLTVAGGCFLLAILVAGYRGSAPEPLLIASLGSILAWDIGIFAVGVGEQLGRDAETSRLEVVHAAASLLVGVVGAGAVYGVFLAVGGGQPASAVVFLLFGVVVLVSVLRRPQSG